ncbi:LAFE_0G19064g1_1 [Lachancea fermentati]|uniref:LAFE_0G19064g1_1 n=1 Tax=Lachancea fermentati TaxID=4955 RepID=A0A1G4MIZ2_LACFM|nr:LAFE_0G19064g1_1 [Lachancea fermentati]
MVLDLFYVKNTISTAIMAQKIASNLHGYKLNARNLSFSSERSPTREGASIEALDSALGVKTYIDGIIHKPAPFHGLYGSKTSHGRFPYMNVINSYGPRSFSLAYWTIYITG